MAAGLQKWQENFFEDCAMQACIFVPVQIFNFKYRFPSTGSSSSSRCHVSSLCCCLAIAA